MRCEKKKSVNEREPKRMKQTDNNNNNDNKSDPF